MTAAPEPLSPAPAGAEPLPRARVVRLRGRWTAAWLMAVWLAVLLSAWPWGVVWHMPWRALLALARALGLSLPAVAAEGLVLGGAVGLAWGTTMTLMQAVALRPRRVFRGGWWVLHPLVVSTLTAVVWAWAATRHGRLPTWTEAGLAGLLWALGVTLGHPLSWRSRAARWWAAYALGALGFFVLMVLPPAAVVRLSPPGWRETLRMLALAPLVWAVPTVWALPAPPEPPEPPA